jgi:hypothetical protein
LVTTFKIIVDTNVPKTANGHHEKASTGCATSCRHRIKEIVDGGIVVIDDSWLII